MTQIFTCTSDAPYDRHNYEVVLTNGQKRFFEHWKDAQGYWIENNQIPDFLDFVIVKDKKSISKRGFAQ